MPPVRLRHLTSDQPASLIDGPASADWARRGSTRRDRRRRRGWTTPCWPPRQRLHQVLLVHRAEQRVRGRGELAHHQAAARPGHPGHLPHASTGSTTLRIPKLIVTASNDPSANGNRVASPATFGTSRAAARRPTSRPRSRAATHQAPDARQLHRRHRGARREVEHPVAGPDPAAPRAWPAATAGPGRATARCW